MKANELREKSAEELRKIKLKLLKELFVLRMKKKSDQIIPTHRFKQIRKDVARIETVLTENPGGIQ